jgi:hypothetical protein
MNALERVRQQLNLNFSISLTDSSNIWVSLPCWVEWQWWRLPLQLGRLRAKVSDHVTHMWLWLDWPCLLFPQGLSGDWLMSPEDWLIPTNHSCHCWCAWLNSTVLSEGGEDERRSSEVTFVEDSGTSGGSMVPKVPLFKRRASRARSLHIRMRWGIISPNQVSSNGGKLLVKFCSNFKLYWSHNLAEFNHVDSKLRSGSGKSLDGAWWIHKSGMCQIFSPVTCFLCGHHFMQRARMLTSGWGWSSGSLRACSE